MQGVNRIILASASTTRRDLLKKAGVSFRVVESAYRERFDATKTPRRLAKHLAYQKAYRVAKKHPSALVIGADTLMVLDRKTFGKPRSVREHRTMLKRMSGRTHTMITGVAIVGLRSGARKIFCRETRVTFRRLSDKEIAAYAESGEGKIAAGGYRIQRGAKKFVRRIRGNIDKVIGLPVQDTLRALRVAGARTPV